MKNISKNINSKISNFVSEQNKIQSDFLEFKEIDFASVTHIARSRYVLQLTFCDAEKLGRLQKPYDAILWGNFPLWMSPMVRRQWDEAIR